MKVIVFSNIPSPYRIDFFNELGKNVDLTVVFEAKTAPGIKFNWNLDQIKNFNAKFLKEGDIKEKRINFNILKYIKRNKYDHIIVTNYSYYTEMFALLTLKLLRIPYFLEIDGGIIKSEPVLLKKYKTFLISNAKGYFSPSNHSDKYLLFYGAKENLIFRYPFTSLNIEDILSVPITQSEKNLLKKELGLSSNKVVLAVGQFIYRKGFDVLLKSFEKVKGNVSLYLIGGTPPTEYHQIIDDLKLSNVYFLDFLKKEELSSYYKMADVFILPTREDIWGLVINEAMSYGLPVISTNNCIAALELVQDEYNGYIVDVNDISMLSMRINTILNDNQLKNKMALNSIERIKEYTIENMVKIHLNVFDEYE